MKKGLLPVIVGVAVLTAAGCHHNTPPPVTPTVSPTPPVASQPALRDKAVVYVVNPKATDDQDLLMPRTVSLHHSASPVRDAIQALLEAKGSPLPSGIALRGLTVDNGLATLDFSASPINETGGEGSQSPALNALARTLGQFPEIKQYQMEVKGQPVKSLGEEGTLDGPMDVIPPDTEQQAKGTAP